MVPTSTNHTEIPAPPQIKFPQTRHRPSPSSLPEPQLLDPDQNSYFLLSPTPARAGSLQPGDPSEGCVHLISTAPNHANRSVQARFGFAPASGPTPEFPV